MRCRLLLLLKGKLNRIKILDAKIKTVVKVIIMDKNKSDLDAISSALVRSRNSLGSPRCFFLIITSFVLFCITALAWITGYYFMLKICSMTFIFLAAHAFFTRDEYRYSSWDNYIVALLINYSPINKGAYHDLLLQVDKNSRIHIDLIEAWIEKERCRT